MIGPRCFVSAVCTLSFAMPVLGAERYDGRWAEDIGACTDESALAVPVTVRPLSLSWPGAFCMVRTSYRVRDAMVLGLWMTPFLKKLFEDYIAQNGGNPRALTAALNR